MGLPAEIAADDVDIAYLRAQDGESAPSHVGPVSKTRQRVMVACAVAMAAATAHYLMRDPRYPGSDFSLVWFGSRAFLAGRNPYALVGPGLEFDWPWGLYYPATAFVAAAPLTVFPRLWASVVFVALSAASFTYAITRDGWNRLPSLVSIPFCLAIVAAQWSPLAASAAIIPAAAWVLAAKPTIGFAIGLSSSRAVLRNAAAGGLLLLATSLAMQPLWIAEWLSVTSQAHHVEPPIFRFGGGAILVVLLRWRLWESRLLILMALVPQTGSWYELVPLFLIGQTRNESMVLSMTTGIGWLLGGLFVTADFDDKVGALMVATGYLPCAIMILRRGNTHSRSISNDTDTMPTGGDHQAAGT